MQAAAAVEVSERTVVTGGRLKNVWVPQPLRDQFNQVVEAAGKRFLALSSTDYMLGQFLYGAANKKVAGKVVRNLPEAGIVRRLWKERDRVQEEAFQRQWGRAAHEHVPEADNALLSGIFEEGGGGGAEQEAPTQSERAGQRERQRYRRLLEQLPPFYEVCVPSAKDGQTTVSFVVARAAPECLVAIELSAASLQNFFDEVNAEVEAAALPEEPSTPPRRQGKRRTHPLAPSPGGASSPPTSRRSKRPSSSFDKRRGRVIGRWRNRSGRWEYEIRKPEDPTDAEAVALLRKEVKELVLERHVEERRKRTR